MQQPQDFHQLIQHENALATLKTCSNRSTGHHFEPAQSLLKKYYHTS